MMYVRLTVGLNMVVWGRSLSPLSVHKENTWKCQGTENVKSERDPGSKW